MAWLERLRDRDRACSPCYAGCAVTPLAVRVLPRQEPAWAGILDLEPHLT